MYAAFLSRRESNNQPLCSRPQHVPPSQTINRGPPIIYEDTDDEDLDEEKTNYDEITHDGVDYLEDVETGDVYNMEYKLVGKWNENADDIIWENDDARRTHEESAY